MEPLYNSSDFKYRGDKIDPLTSNRVDLKAEISEWYCSNETKVIEDEKNDREYKVRHYTIRMFATTEKGTSVGINVYNYTPHYFIKVPENFANNKFKMNNFVSGIKNRLPYQTRNNLVAHDLVMRKDLWGFTNGKYFPFIRLIFKDTNSMNATLKIIKSEDVGEYKYKRDYDIYESNIPPFLRFIHKNNIQPAGWIVIKAGNYTINYGESRKTRCQIDIDVTDWKKVKFYETSKIAPFLVAVTDIECYSSHGDFPLPKKNYKKLVQELYDAYHKKKEKEIPKNTSMVGVGGETITSAELFKMKMQITKELISEAFNKDNSNSGDISRIYTKEEMEPTESEIEYVAYQCTKILETKENYAILANNLINYILESSSGLEYQMSDTNIHNYICDCFADPIDPETNKEVELNDNAVRMFTKSNKKPSIKTLSRVAHNCEKVLKKVYKTLKKIMIDRDIFKVMSKFQCDNDNEHIKLTNVSREIKKSAVQTLYQGNNQLISIFQEEFPPLDTTKDTTIERMLLVTGELPQVSGDEIIQIGTVVQRYADKEPALRHIITLDTCDPIPNTIVEQYDTEEEVIIAWAQFINRLDPDVISGYNVFGFDFAYIWKRAQELDIVDDIKYLFGRVKNLPSNLEIKKLASSALGDNTLMYITTPGIVQMDLLKVIQRDHNLVSYKLDFVAENFINDKIKSVQETDKKANTTVLKIDGSNTLYPGNFITIDYISKTTSKDYKEQKFKILEIDNSSKTIKVKGLLDPDVLFNETNSKHKWQLAKDDVSPKEIFEFQKQGPTKRAIVASYCVQDCALCHTIINKLQIITNNKGMANVCYVPLSFIFLRGQGIKIFSLVSKECKDADTLIPVIKYSQEEKKQAGVDGIIPYNFNNKFTPDDADEEVTENDGGYEGAIVLKPKPGIYIKKPVTVLDYASLYPSSMISENLSHDSLVISDKYLGDSGIKELEKIGYGYVDVTHDVFKWKDPKIRSKGKVKIGTKTCRFVQPPNKEKSIIPKILMKLLKARKDTRAKIKTAETEFMKGVLDGLQLAYKLTANSLYGQIGAVTSPINMKDIAASTTAVGRSLLNLAKTKTIERFPDAEIVYGDTDSIFINYNPKDEEGNDLEGRAALKKSIDMGVETENYIRQFLKAPHNLEYEKTFSPFILFSKKRYIGNLYEFDLDSYKQKSMGIVLKRRDNADIVKHIYGKVIDIIMNKKNLAASIEFCRSECKKLLDGGFPLETLIITKSLRGYYKNPDQIAHKVLADRIGERDPGNKPKSNDRIPFVYIDTKPKPREDGRILQGDKIEHPDFIRENSIKPDYKFYITNQIMKPVGQIYALAVTELPEYKKGKDYFDKKYNELVKVKEPEKATEKVKDLRYKEASDIIFSEVLRIAENRKNKTREITDFFKVTRK